MEKSELLRIKEHLEHHGWVNQYSSWDREDLTRSVIVVKDNGYYDGVHMELVLSEQDIWILDLSIDKSRIVHAHRPNKKAFFFLDTTKDSKFEPEKSIPIMEFERLFFGKILDRHELFTLMRQVDCPLSTKITNR